MSTASNKELSAAAVIAADGTTYSEEFTLPTDAKEIYFQSVISSRTDGTFTLTLEHSLDGTNWYTYVANAAQSADGSIIGTYTANPIAGHVRVKILAASTTTGATVQASIYYSQDY